MQDFWITFVTDLDPGGMLILLVQQSPLLVKMTHDKGGWPRYDLDSKQVMQLQRDNLTHIRDGETQSLRIVLAANRPPSKDWDEEKTDFSNTVRVLREFQK